MVSRSHWTNLLTEPNSSHLTQLRNRGRRLVSALRRPRGALLLQGGRRGRHPRAQRRCFGDEEGREAPSADSAAFRLHWRQGVYTATKGAHSPAATADFRNEEATFESLQRAPSVRGPDSEDHQVKAVDSCKMGITFSSSQLLKTRVRKRRSRVRPPPPRPSRRPAACAC